MRKPHENQGRILEFIKREIQEKGYPPSVREICAAVGLKSTSTVHCHLQKLEERGLLRRDSTKPRALEILGDESVARGRSIPIVGKVTAGIPILAQENIEDHLVIPEEFAGDTETFILTVRGESMIQAGILSGDYVVVRKQDTANNGDIVVAMIDDEATVKTFYREKNHIRLQPENPYMDPIIVRNCVILGKVISLFRKIV